MDLQSLRKALTRLVMVAVRSFVLTVLVLAAAGLILAACSYWVLSDQPGYASIAAGIALLESVATGVVLGAKRGLILSMAHGLSSLRLGRAAVRLVFGRLLGINADQAIGERGGRIARGFERLPLAQAEAALNDTVTDLVSAQPAGGGLHGWLRRKLRSKLLLSVQKYTLARLREQDARQGGVDLVKVQINLEERIDELLVGKLRHGLNVWTLLVIIGLPSVVAAQTYIVLALLK